MMRRLPAVLILGAVVLAAGIPHSRAQSRSATASTHAALDEATRLTEQVVKPYGEGKYQEAIAPAEQALTLREKALGPDHLDVASSMNNLARLYKEQGMYARAKPLYIRALAIDERMLGPSHPSVADTLGYLATLYQAQGAYDRAEPLLARAARIREQQLHDELGPLSETRKQDWIGLLQGETDHLVSFHADIRPGPCQRTRSRVHNRAGLPSQRSAP